MIVSVIVLPHILEALELFVVGAFGVGFRRSALQLMAEAVDVSVSTGFRGT